MTEREPLKPNDAFEDLVSSTLKEELDEKVRVRAWTWEDLRDIRNGVAGNIIAALILAMAAVAIVMCQTFVDLSETKQTPQNAPLKNPVQEGPVPTVRKPEKEGWYVIDI